jgi:hypothetical protein
MVSSDSLPVRRTKESTEWHIQGPHNNGWAVCATNLFPNLTFHVPSLTTTTGRDKNGYYHELFLRGKRSLAHRIPRCKLKGQGARKPTSPETEPNFYLYSFLPMEQSNDRSVDSSPQTNAAGSGAIGTTTASSASISRQHSSLSLEQILLSNVGVPLPQHPSSSSCGVPEIGQLTGHLTGQYTGHLTGHLALGLPSRSLFLEALAASLTQGNRMFMDQRSSLMQGRLPLSSMGVLGGMGLGAQQHHQHPHQQSLLDSLMLCSQQRSAPSLARAPPALSDLLNADLALRMALSREARGSSAANNATAMN